MQLVLPLGQPRPDEFIISIYKRVWDKNITKRYFEYPFPALGFYGFLPSRKIATGKDMIIHELKQNHGHQPKQKQFHSPEQNKSLDPNVFGKGLLMVK